MKQSTISTQKSQKVIYKPKSLVQINDKFIKVNNQVFNITNAKNENHDWQLNRQEVLAIIQQSLKSYELFVKRYTLRYTKKSAEKKPSKLVTPKTSPTPSLNVSKKAIPISLNESVIEPVVPGMQPICEMFAKLNQSIDNLNTQIVGLRPPPSFQKLSKQKLRSQIKRLELSNKFSSLESSSKIKELQARADLQAAKAKEISPEQKLAQYQSLVEAPLLAQKAKMDAQLETIKQQLQEKSITTQEATQQKKALRNQFNDYEQSKYKAMYQLTGCSWLNSLTPTEQQTLESYRRFVTNKLNTVYELEDTQQQLELIERRQDLEYAKQQEMEEKFAPVQEPVASKRQKPLKSRR